MKDGTNRHLEIGDTVVAIDSHYKDFIVGKIVGFTAAKVKLEIIKAPGSFNKPGDTVLKFLYQVSRIDYCKPEDLVNAIKD